MVGDHITPHPSPLPQGAREYALCAKHTEKNLFTYLPIHLFTLILSFRGRKPEESHGKEVLRFAQDDGAPYPLPLREREELLSEHSELSNSGEGYKELPSPDASRHPPPREGKFVIQRAKPDESHVQKVLRYAQDDETDIINVTLNLFQGLIAAKTRHFDKMLKQVQHDNFSCAEYTVKNLFTYLLIYLFTYLPIHLITYSLLKKPCFLILFSIKSKNILPK